MRLRFLAIHITHALNIIQESDYLHLIYHLYDSEGSDSEAEEEEKQRRARLAALQAKLKSVKPIITSLAPCSLDTLKN